MKHVRESGKEYPFICIAPQCPRDKYWACYTESLLAFLDYVCEILPVDMERVYLTGLSMGGTGTWMLAMCDPHRFSCIVPVCGTGIVWNAKRLANLPIRIYHGDDDPIVPFEESVVMLRELTRAGADVKLTICYGVGEGKNQQVCYIFHGLCTGASKITDNLMHFAKTIHFSGEF